jgi:hypothetical protein
MLSQPLAAYLARSLLDVHTNRKCRNSVRKEKKKFSATTTGTFNLCLHVNCVWYLLASVLYLNGELVPVCLIPGMKVGREEEEQQTGQHILILQENKNKELHAANKHNVTPRKTTAVFDYQIFRSGFILRRV